jgi:hypothetical protein
MLGAWARFGLMTEISAASETQNQDAAHPFPDLL